MNTKTSTSVSTNRSPDILIGEDIVNLLRGQMLRSKFGIKSLFLFGSVARNEATQDSDLDFMVSFEGAITFDKYINLKLFLEDMFGKKIDLAIEGSLKPQIRQKITEESIDVT
jgi:uncharacterized protein